MKAIVHFQSDYAYTRMIDALREYEKSEQRSERKEEPNTHQWQKEREYQRTLAERVVEVLRDALIHTDPPEEPAGMAPFVVEEGAG